MHASESHLGNHTTKSYLASFAHGNPEFKSSTTRKITKLSNTSEKKRSYN
ncbi:hypothetical protein Hanom_Chr16g01431861 [Helianthus anomalus]